MGPVGAGAERRNNPLTKHGNINQHQSLERRPLAPTSRYCLHLHPARKNVMLDRDIDGPVSRFTLLLPLFLPPFRTRPSIHPARVLSILFAHPVHLFPPSSILYIYIYISSSPFFLVEEKIFFSGEKSCFESRSLESKSSTRKGIIIGKKGFCFIHLFQF